MLHRSVSRRLAATTVHPAEAAVAVAARVDRPKAAEEPTRSVARVVLARPVAKAALLKVARPKAAMAGRSTVAAARGPAGPHRVATAPT